ncbi:hypothetical protein EDB83DRAFT_2522885 [Lactarius deliciosus]|nr:hypothetical protein EDB83DRAFT_2522885 [Lactarius deliciosus]
MFPSSHPRHRHHLRASCSPAIAPPQTIPPSTASTLPHAQVHRHYHPIMMRKTAPTHSTSSSFSIPAHAPSAAITATKMNNEGHAADADSRYPHPIPTWVPSPLLATLAKYDVPARAQRPRHLSIICQHRPLQPTFTVELREPTVLNTTRERLVEPRPHRIGLPHGSPRYQNYLRAALAPDVHKTPSAVPPHKTKKDDHGRQREDCGGDAKTIKNHGNDDEDNQDDHGGGKDDAKTITAAATAAKTIKTAAMRRRSGTTVAAAAMTRRESRQRSDAKAATATTTMTRR